MKIKAELIHEPKRLCPAWCQVEKVVEVDGLEFDAFLTAPQEVWPFLEDNAEMMHQWMGVDHCLLVLAEGRTDGVLVNSEGSGYARYAAYLPRAKPMLAAGLERAVDLMIRKCTGNAGVGSRQTRLNNRPASGSCRVPLEELEEQLGLIIRAGNGLDAMLMEALRRRPEVSAVELAGGCVSMDYDLSPRKDTAVEKKPSAPFTIKRKAQLFENAVSAVCEIFDYEDLYVMLHDSFGLTLQEIRAHNYMSDREIAETCGVPEELLDCDLAVRDILKLDGIRAKVCLSCHGSDNLAMLEGLKKLTPSGQEDFAALLDAHAADIRIDDEGKTELVLEGVEAAELELFCNALDAHEQAERTMGDMTP